MTRNDLQDIAKIRLRDARALLKNGNFEGAYYLCGYIIECGLKACIAKKTRKYEFPDRKTVNASYSHNLKQLIKTAGLEIELKNNLDSNPEFRINWSVVKDWSENSRYERRSRKEAEDIYSAIINRQHGVFKWIKQHW